MPPTTTTWECNEECNAIASCRDSISGSYCKTWVQPSVCFGILVKDDGELCYESVDEGCDGTPYPCGQVFTTEASTEGTTETPTEETTETPTEEATEESSGAPTGEPTTSSTEYSTEPITVV
ncbi:hypothetical protein Pmar_PMAR024146 [Perkinsus marinus ATCC 50983]|uniref:Uncharacterized protein n=1 Tax=Perkinsus marinus (strain ATCC 50983 / TXsc) TaxID=423536 RepID=C5L2B0_PERM5|nr:hypothetical protein Pmar_PMAR024146 [Perkinsus marinus ATCC 50983]EER09122.1 hypothetical protein Pmar_PMAR024146 [Perkinsus marinus ATCC 50983]|eukprot:XP_002777306.1 hypothetical protein Pmar_PMAR024146 [Perkinsus marinus ATCC 50983]